jgi:hypothetical protein
MEFELKIATGNAAMQTADAVASALRDVAQRLNQGFALGSVSDDNGNTVGTWVLTGEER